MHTFKIVSDVVTVDRVQNAEVKPTDIVVGWADVSLDELPTLTIHQRWLKRLARWGESSSYYVNEIPVGNGFDGRAFRLAKQESDAGDTYDCFVARNGQDNICDCPAHSYKGYCKHISALQHLIAKGVLVHPQDRPAIADADLPAMPDDMEDPFAGVSLATDDVQF